MLIIINDDPAFVSWISRHRHGFVVDSPRKPAKNHLILHRAVCSIIKPHKRARLTSGTHLKACSQDATELVAWAQEQTGGGLKPCSACQPDDQINDAAENHVDHSLTRLGREILSYVLDLAVISLDDARTPFRLTVDDVAAYVAKSPAQIKTAIARLTAEGYLLCDETAGLPAARGAITYPTAKALRSIPAFGEMPEASLREELETLRSAP